MYVPFWVAIPAYLLWVMVMIMVAVAWIGFQILRYSVMGVAALCQAVAEERRQRKARPLPPPRRGASAQGQAQPLLPRRVPGPPAAPAGGQIPDRQQQERDQVERDLERLRAELPYAPAGPPFRTEPGDRLEPVLSAPLTVDGAAVPDVEDQDD
jgi:hypothetical protein